ncbi:MAG TPA: protoporphyrinogen oxidase [Opitutaceae bacterium]
MTPSSTSPSTLPVAVIGGGITGLTAAYHLVRAGRTVRLFEASDRLGGVIRSERDGDWLIEAGPNSLQENSSALSQLIADLGLEPEKCAALPSARNRYILRRGQPCAAPLSPPGLLTSPLFSFGAKLRVLTEIFSRPRFRKQDISLAEFGRAHFGREFVDYALNPFVSGVYAGNVEKLSARHAFPSLWESERTHGSIIRAQIAGARAKRARGEKTGAPPIVSFREGLVTLPRALGARLPAGAVELGARVEGLIPGPSWRVIWSREGATHTEEFASVVLALPSAALARIPVGTLGERPLAGLDGIEYPPVSSLFLGYRREQVAHPLDGFGLLVPANERRSVLGVLFSSSLFAGRAPAGHVALTVMAGGANRPDLGRLPLAELLPKVRSELAEILGVSGEPVFIRHNAWARAIPQYNLGFERHLEAMERCERAHPGLYIGGQARDGIALTACIAAGRKLAERAGAV